jgi:hypothetical protein
VAIKIDILLTFGSGQIVASIRIKTFFYADMYYEYIYTKSAGSAGFKFSASRYQPVMKYRGVGVIEVKIDCNICFTPPINHHKHTVKTIVYCNT